MSFSTNIFLTLFLPVAFVISFLMRKDIHNQNCIIIVLNIMFLLYVGIGNVVIIFIFCIWNYCIANILQIMRKSKFATLLFDISIIIDMVPLILFKYTVFIINVVNCIFNMSYDTFSWIMPVGLSFYTFQSISLLSDIKTQKINYRPRFFEVCFYLSFFTTISSGPIMRFDSIHDQMFERLITAERINNGITRFVIGLGKKVLIANNLAIYVDDVFSSTSDKSLSILAYWLGSFAFTIQLYLDFSGYSDMAIGISEILGFSISENFDYPYTAKSIGEFWRRWHISLGAWFRDYIYIPLGGNRVSVYRHIINLFVVWLLTGLWHGTGLTFIVWGLLNCVFLVFEKYFKRVFDFLKSSFWGHIYTLLLVNFLWVFFRADTIHVAFIFISKMFGADSAGVSVEYSTLHIIPFLIVSFIFCIPIGKLFAKFKGNILFEVAETLILCIITIASVFSISNSNYSPFLYASF